METQTQQIKLCLDAGRVVSDTEEGTVEEPEEEPSVRKKRKIEEEVNRKLTIIGCINNQIDVAFTCPVLFAFINQQL